MTDSPRPPHEPPSEDGDRSPRDPVNVPASVTFMEIMREAAARIDAQRETSASPPTAPQAIPPASALPDAPALTADAPPLIEPLPTPAAPPVRRRRAPSRVQRTVGTISGLLRSIVLVVLAAGLTATIFTWWTPPDFINQRVREGLSVAIATQAATAPPTGVPTPNWAYRLGVVAGHMGPENDPGAVCPDGLTELEINIAVAQRVVRNLRGLGYTVDLLDEFDPRLDNYQATALVSIHSNSCTFVGATGFLIASAAARISARGDDDLLVRCVKEHYQRASGLAYREGVTVDMTDYHNFREIHPLTPAAILELGFMLDDRDLLVNEQDRLAQGITDGILCFIQRGRS